jgi:photosystem II Psb27 protein
MKRLLSRLFSLILVASLLLVGCSGTSTSGLTGSYLQDTIAVIDSLRTAINLPDDSPDKAPAQADAKAKINDYISQYRRNDKVSGSASFMTMSTALNGLASHYNSSPNRPIPEKLKTRLEQEFKQIEISLKREAEA